MRECRVALWKTVGISGVCEHFTLPSYIQLHVQSVSKTEMLTCSRHKDYLEALPEGKPKGTIVLIHGFPDISLGWRYQIPHFVKLGYRTIALDCMGYGKTVSSTN